MANYKNLKPNNLLFPLLFAGQFLALTFESILKISGLYFLVFAVASIYGVKKILGRYPSRTVNQSDLLWIVYFILFLFSAGLIGHTIFLNFFIYFTSQAIIPFFLGRALHIDCNIKKLNSYFNLIFVLYVFILFFLYLKDPEIFQADRFYPFLDRSANDAGGDPTQLFLGYGLVFILLSNYFMVRSNDDDINHGRILKIIIVLFCVAILLMLGSRSTFLALLILLLSNEFAGKISYKKVVSILLGALIVVGLGINLLPEERLVFFNELWFIFGAATDNIICTGSEDGSVLYRLSGALQSLDLFLTSPIFGVGVGNYGWLHCGDKGDFIYPHNIIAQILAEMGIVGLFIFSACIYKTYKVYTINNRVLFFLNKDQADINKLFFNFWIFCLFVAIFSGNSYGDPLLYLLSGVVSKKIRLNSAISLKNNIRKY
jgi:O-antigen ligase